MTGWQPIDTAPKDGTWVDLWSDGQRYANHFWRPAHNAWACTERRGRGPPYTVTMVRRDLKPTHWMPLPEPPEGA